MHLVKHSQHTSMKMGCHKLVCYFLADFLPILIAFVLLLTGLPVVLCCSKRCKRLKDFVVFLMEQYFKQVGEKKSKTAKMSKLTSEIDISKVKFDNPKIYGTFLLAACFSLTYVAAQLWDAFVVRVQQDNCVDGLDCYLFDGQLPLTTLKKPPLNCTDFARDFAGDLVDSNRFRIFCYKLTWDYNRVSKDFGGALASAGIEFLLIAGLSQQATRCWYREKDQVGVQYDGGETLELKSEDERRNVEGGSKPGKKKNKFCLKVVPYHIGMLVVASATAFGVIFIPVIILWPGWDVYLLSDITKPIQHFTSTMQILIAFSIPWPIAK